MKKKFDVYSNIPSELLVKLQKLSYECEGKWREAKEKNNYKIVKKEFINLYKAIREKSKILSDLWNLDEYDVLLSLYDRSFNCKEISEFANDVESFIIKKYDDFISRQNKKKF